jgi:hypothetical protein
MHFAGTHVPARHVTRGVPGQRDQYSADLLHGGRARLAANARAPSRSAYAVIVGGRPFRMTVHRQSPGAISSSRDMAPSCRSTTGKEPAA